MKTRLLILTVYLLFIIGLFTPLQSCGDSTTPIRVMDLETGQFYDVYDDVLTGAEGAYFTNGKKIDTLIVAVALPGETNRPYIYGAFIKELPKDNKYYHFIKAVVVK